MGDNIDNSASQFLDAQDGEWVNFDVKVSQGGKWYCEIDTWKPADGQMQGSPQEQQQGPQPAGDFGDFNDSIPF